MAITLSQKDKISIRLAGIVSSALNTIKNVRRVETAKKESLFQEQVAAGNLTYAAQLEFRKKQLEEENNATSPDEEFIATLNESIGTTKKLIRYEKYRTKYYKNYEDMAAGRITAKDQMSFLEDQLKNTSDPDFKAEIQKEIVDAQKEVTQYENSITSNLVTRAMNDKTVPTLEDAIDRVKSKRATASLNNNEDEVTAYDAQLSSLNSQLSKTKISDKMNSIEVNTTLKGLSPLSKLDSINLEISKAASFSPVTIDGINYKSEKDYWTQTRDNYLAGSGSGVFQNFSAELKDHYDTEISNAVNRDGFVSNVSLNSIKTDFDTLKTKPEVQPFIDKIGNLESTVMLTAVDTAAKKIITNTLLTGDTKEFQNADTYLKQYQSKYGVSTEDYRADLNTKMTNLAVGSDNTALLKATTDKQNAGEFKTPTPNGEIPPTEVKPVIPLSNPNKNLQAGSKGADVVKLQEQLGGLQPDGDFGEKTKAAVIAFQTANGLTPDGIVGTITAKKLEEVKKNAVVPPAESVAPVTPKVEVAPVTPPVVEKAPVAPIVPPPTPSKIYTVKAGDTIGAIAQKYGVTPDKIKGYKSGNANKINIGEVLTIQ